MKRTLLLFALLVANVTFLFAQNSLQIIDEDGNAVASGTVFKVRTTNLNEYQIVSPDFLIKNTSSADLTIQVKKEVIEMVVGSTNDFCFAGNCYLGTTYVAPPNGLLLPAGSTTAESDEFTAHYKPFGNEGITLVKYTFYNMADESDATHIIVDYYAGPNVGIAEYDSEATLSAYPNPATDMLTIDYSVKAQKNARLVIYNINGQKHYEQNLASEQSSVMLSVANYPKGMYLYRIEGDNYQTTYAKIIVQ